MDLGGAPGQTFCGQFVRGPDGRRIGHGQGRFGPSSGLLGRGQPAPGAPFVAFLAGRRGRMDRLLLQPIELLLPAVRSDQPEPRRPTQIFLDGHLGHSGPELGVVLQDPPEGRQGPVGQAGEAEQLANRARRGDGRGHRLSHPGDTPGQLQGRPQQSRHRRRR